MASVESVHDRDSKKLQINGDSEVELGERYMVQRADGSWRKFATSPVVYNLKATVSEAPGLKPYRVLFLQRRLCKEHPVKVTNTLVLV